MIPPARTLAKMFLDRRPHRGGHEFRFRPHYRQQDGTDVVRVMAKDGAMDARVFLRPASSDLLNFEQIFLGGDYNVHRLPRQQEIVELYRSMRTPLIVDLGANIGLASLYFQKSWPRATVVAVEPDADNFRMLCRNAPEVTPIHAAIASERGRATIVNPDSAAWGYQTRLAHEGAIEAITVADILERHPACQPFICKIDIEGAEKELFSKNTDWLAAFPVVIIELHDWMAPGGATARNFLRRAADLDRDFLVAGENVWSIANRCQPTTRSAANEALFKDASGRQADEIQL
ncbi:MAG TPA: FkbM family methyltransferase [Nitrospiraceae bacterium]|nr:FkbM family methyltransferase [Nitrospiraceae bacterium]